MPTAKWLEGNKRPGLQRVMHFTVRLYSNFEAKSMPLSETHLKA